jgi:hypothetical protein
VPVARRSNPGVSGIPALETLTPEPARADEPDLFALTETVRAGKRQKTFVFDGSKQFPLVRGASFANQPQPHPDLDIGYRYYPDVMLWLPSAWSLTSFRPSGEIDHALDARVTHVEINPAISDDAFSLEFPIDTMVSDNRPGSEGSDPTFQDAAKIVRPAGEMRIVTRSERGKPFDILRHGDPHSIAKTSRKARKPVVPGPHCDQRYRRDGHCGISAISSTAPVNIGCEISIGNNGTAAD